MNDARGGVLVYADRREALLELLAKARNVAMSANVSVTALVLGQHAAADCYELGRWGADFVLSVDGPEFRHLDAESCSDVLVQVSNEIRPRVVVIGGSKWGYELAARAAERIGAGCVSGCIDWSMKAVSLEVEARSMLYTGLGIATYRVTSVPGVLVVSPTGKTPDAFEERLAEVRVCNLKVRPSRVEVLSVRPAAATVNSPEGAEVILDIGQGVRQREDLVSIQRLADQLRAVVSCTRPIAAERGWFEEWLGLSGHKVSPRLCITLGVSGAIQHMVGIRGAKTIVAVDVDPDSAMHVQADYGVVTDLYEFVPALINALEAREIELRTDAPA